MALSFLKHGVTERLRNSKRKAKAPLITWEELPSYFQDQLNTNPGKLIRETKWAKDFTNGDYPMEARIMFRNANVPFGHYPNTQELCKSVPCKDMNQGKKQLEEFIQGLNNDQDTQKVVAQWIKSRKGFDASTIPGELLGGQLTTTT